MPAEGVVTRAVDDCVVVEDVDDDNDVATVEDGHDGNNDGEDNSDVDCRTTPMMRGIGDDALTDIYIEYVDDSEACDNVADNDGGLRQ